MLEHKLKESFDKYFEAPLEVWRNFVNLCDQVEFKRNETIKETNQTEKYAYYILSGACGVFLWKQDNFVCLDIILENDFFADHLSLINSKSSPLETVALEKNSALRISKLNIEKLRQSNFGAVLFLIGAENSFVEK